MSAVKVKKEGFDGAVLQLYAKGRSMEVVISVKGPFEKAIFGLAFLGTGFAAWSNLG